MEFETYEELQDFCNNSVTVKEISQDLNIPERYIKNKIKKGKLQARIITGSYRILRSEVLNSFNKKMRGD